MHPQTIKKAQQLVRNKNIKLLSGSSWGYMHFEVTDVSGSIINVWREEKQGELEWHCDSKTKAGFGCVMTNPFQKSPSCCHTLAVELWLRNKAKGELNG